MEALRCSGNYADGSTFWIAAPDVTPVALTPEHVEVLDNWRARYSGTRQDGFVPIAVGDLMLFTRLAEATP